MGLKKLPAFQFYPGDWMKDPSLRATSIAARGLWIDMICLMHESPIRGELMITRHTPMSEAQVARVVGLSEQELLPLLEELVNNGVVSVARDNGIPTYYSVRMVRDEMTRVKLSEAGKKGGQPKHVAKGYPTDKPEQGSSSSSSSSSSPSSSSSSSLSSTTSHSTTPQGIKEGDLMDVGVDDVYSAIPVRNRKQPRTAKKAIATALSYIEDNEITGEHSARYKRVLATERLADAINVYYKSDEGKSKFARYPAKWLDQHAWQEDMTAWNKSNGEGGRM